MSRYTTNTSQDISSADDTLVFTDEIESVRAEARRLKEEEGIDIIIALGHGGYEEVDLAMAEQVEEVDVIVGGHSHTFLYRDVGFEGEKVTIT